jgi:phage-related protein
VIEFVLAGTQHEIYYIYEGGHFTFRDFLNKVKAQGPVAGSIRGEARLQGKKPSPKEWKKLIAALDRIAQHGFRMLEKTNLIKTWTEDDGTEVCEIRKGNVRVLFFEDEPQPADGPTRLVITHAFFKKSDETPRREIERFLRMRKQYYAWKFDAD